MRSNDNRDGARDGGRDGRRDPTLVRNQQALTTSTGRVWLVVGAILGAICVGVLLLQVRNSVGQAIVGAVVVAVLYAALVAVRIFAVAGRPRLTAMAVIFAAIPVWTLVWLFVIAARS